jgi:hypothetical protein
MTGCSAGFGDAAGLVAEAEAFEDGFEGEAEFVVGAAVVFVEDEAVDGDVEGEGDVAEDVEGGGAGSSFVASIWETRRPTRSARASGTSWVSSRCRRVTASRSAKLMVAQVVGRVGAATIWRASWASLARPMEDSRLSHAILLLEVVSAKERMRET